MTEGKKSITRLEQSTITNICSNQVILDLPGVIKELIENSIDAKATTIQIFMKQFGKDYIEVKDNGTGIDQDNFKLIAQQEGTTSKLETFDGLESINTYGFRGQALNALNFLGDLTIQSRTESNNELG